jgi:hypothetical protein
LFLPRVVAALLAVLAGRLVSAVQAGLLVWILAACLGLLAARAAARSSRR